MDGPYVMRSLAPYEGGRCSICDRPVTAGTRYYVARRFGHGSGIVRRGEWRYELCHEGCRQRPDDAARR